LIKANYSRNLLDKTYPLITADSWGYTSPYRNYINFFFKKYEAGKRFHSVNLGGGFIRESPVKLIAENRSW
jgi:hypothetical protein